MCKRNGIPKSFLFGFWYKRLFILSEFSFLLLTRMVLLTSKCSFSPTLLTASQDVINTVISTSNAILKC